MAKVINSHRTGREVRTFGVKDGKGREIGGRVTCMEGDIVSDAEKSTSWYNVGAGFVPGATAYGYIPHAMRGGELFGASQMVQWFATPAERDAAVTKYFANAEARGRKTAAK